MCHCTNHNKRELGELTQFLLDFPNLRNPLCLDRRQMAEPEPAASDMQMTAPTGEFKLKGPCVRRKANKLRKLTTHSSLVPAFITSYNQPWISADPSCHTILWPASSQRELF